jgi:hypothetical protein
MGGQWTYPPSLHSPWAHTIFVRWRHLQTELPCLYSESCAFASHTQNDKLVSRSCEGLTQLDLSATSSAIAKLQL